LHALNAFREIGVGDTEKETKRKIVEALDLVATQLGNTRTVCKKYYVHPAIIDLYTDKRLDKYFSRMDTNRCSDTDTDLSQEEKVLMNILETYGKTIVV
jgi:DNA topoisomerase-1